MCCTQPIFYTFFHTYCNLDFLLEFFFMWVWLLQEATGTLSCRGCLATLVGARSGPESRSTLKVSGFSSLWWYITKPVLQRLSICIYSYECRHTLHRLLLYFATLSIDIYQGSYQNKYLFTCTRVVLLFSYTDLSIHFGHSWIYVIVFFCSNVVIIEMKSCLFR